MVEPTHLKNIISSNWIISWVKNTKSLKPQSGLVYQSQNAVTTPYKTEKCKPDSRKALTPFYLEPTCIRVDRVTFTLNMCGTYMRLLVYTGKTPLYNASVYGDIHLYVAVYMWGLRGRYFLTPPSPCPRMYKSAQPFWLEKRRATFWKMQAKRDLQAIRCAYLKGLKQHPISVVEGPL